MGQTVSVDPRANGSEGGAPPYFQCTTCVNTVFAGLVVSHIGEIYLDDIILWGDSIEELTEQLEQLLQSASYFNITFDNNDDGNDYYYNRQCLYSILNRFIHHYF